MHLDSAQRHYTLTLSSIILDLNNYSIFKYTETFNFFYLSPTTTQWLLPCTKAIPLLPQGSETRETEDHQLCIKLRGFKQKVWWRGECNQCQKESLWLSLTHNYSRISDITLEEGPIAGSKIKAFCQVPCLGRHRLKRNQTKEEVRVKNSEELGRTESQSKL